MRATKPRIRGGLLDPRHLRISATKRLTMCPAMCGSCAEVHKLVNEDKGRVSKTSCAKVLKLVKLARARALAVLAREGRAKTS